MADKADTTWPIEPHTLAKHAVLQKYLDAWLPILTSQSARIGSTSEILYIDGFAGPGEYERGEPGSPVIALRSAIEHMLHFPKPVHFLFIEYREDRWRHLNTVIARIEPEIKKSNNVRLTSPELGDCNTVLSKMLNKHEQAGARFGPALAFLDQFGYAAVSMSLIERILKFPQCEIFIYLDYKDMNRWITDPEKAAAFTNTYGGDEWKKAIEMPEATRRDYLLESYSAALRNRAKAKYVKAFSMSNREGRMLYWLIFCTGSIRGLEEMKKAMWSVDNTGNFRFSAKDGKQQPTLLDTYDLKWLADQLKRNLAGKNMTVAQVKEHVLTQTPCYLYKGALKLLEKEDVLKVLNAPAKRRRGDFPNDELLISFSASELF